MIFEFYAFLQILLIVLFLMAFFHIKGKEIIWMICLAISGVLMYSSYYIEFLSYVFNSTLGAYELQAVPFNVPYMMGINFIFFALSIVFLLSDIFDEYGIELFSNFRGKFR